MKTTEKKLKQNREEINNILHSNLPLDIVYYRIKILKEQNERLISKLKNKKFK